jgi:multidrug efflux pump subunit AcrB
MWIFLVGGVVAYFSLNQEEFPDIEVGLLQISVPYLGATPEESETGVCLRLEEALDGTENIDRLTTTAREGGCDATVQLANGADLNSLLNDVKGKIDAITTFPAETEKPIIRAISPTDGVMTIALSSQTDDSNLKVIAEEIRDDLLDLPEISTVNLEFIRPLEISIEVSEFTLRQYGLTLAQISQAISRASLDLPGGTIRTRSGEIMLRTKGSGVSGRRIR